MANHRMFSNRIANSAKFLQMPEGAQLLYFHLVQRADDDGVVESYPVMKLLGTAPDNIKVLFAKGFIKELNEDQVIVIPHWAEHNKIRADRKTNSIYSGLLRERYPEIPFVEPKPRSDVKDNTSRTVHGQSMASIREGKVSKDKISKGNTTSEETSRNKEVAEIIDLFKKTLSPSLSFGNKTQRKAVEAMIDKWDFEKVKRMAEKVISVQGTPYAPRASTPHAMWTKIGDFVSYFQGQSAGGGSKQNNVATV